MTGEVFLNLKESFSCTYGLELFSGLLQGNQNQYAIELILSHHILELELPYTDFFGGPFAYFCEKMQLNFRKELIRIFGSNLPMYTPPPQGHALPKAAAIKCRHKPY